ncbi:MAG: helix-turn-helix domain-containing protein, partial [Moorellaceae bacterium]
MGEYTFLERFGQAILSVGITPIPTGLFRWQKALGLIPEELWFVSYILSYQWKDGLPYPSLRKMAALSGVSLRRIHRTKNHLIEKGYLEVKHQRRSDGGQDRNLYDFSGLFD